MEVLPRIRQTLERGVVSNSGVLIRIADQNLTLAYVVGATDNAFRFHAVDQVGRTIIADFQLSL